MAGERPLKIGELASRSGLPVKTLRYYEDQGLLPAIGRSEGGYRLFGPISLERIAFIRRLKTLGLSLEEIRACLAVHDGGQLPCEAIERQLHAQIERIDQQLAELTRLRHDLTALLGNWQPAPSRRTGEICPNLSAAAPAATLASAPGPRSVH